MKRRVIIAAVLAFLLVLVVAVPALALDAPDSMSIVSAGVYRNLAEDGDMTVVFQYNIAYADFPEDVTAAASIFLRLYSADGLTLLAAKAPSAFFNYGYGLGIASFYFSADDAPAWGGAYIINIAGNPALFDPLPTPANYTLPASDYATSEDQAENQALLTSYVLSCCDIIEKAYPAYILSGSTDVGKVLTALGEVYIRAVIPGAATLAPQLFYTQLYQPEVIPTDYSMDVAEDYRGRLNGTDLQIGLDRLGEEAGLDWETLAAFLIAIAAIGLIIWTNKMNWGSEPGMIGAGIILAFGAIVLGGAAFYIRIIMAFLAGLLLMNRLWLKKA